MHLQGLPILPSRHLTRSPHAWPGANRFEYLQHFDCGGVFGQRVLTVAGVVCACELALSTVILLHRVKLFAILQRFSRGIFFNRDYLQGCHKRRALR